MTYNMSANLYAPSGGGGGGSSAMPFLPPPPSAADVRAKTQQPKPQTQDLGFDDGDFGEFQ